MLLKTKKLDWKHWLIISIFVLSLGLRFTFLSIPHDFWHDDGFTYLFSKEPVSFILDSNDVHPPLYYLFFKCMLFISSNELFLRGINIIFWCLFFWGSYLFLKRHFSFRATWLTLLFMSISTTLIYYSIEPRNYMIAMFFVVMQLYFFFEDIYENKSEKSIFSIGFIIFSLLMLYTHYFTGFLLLVEFLYILPKRDVRIKLKILTNFFFIKLLSIPLIYYLWKTLPKMQVFWFQPNNILSFFSTISYQFIFADSITIYHIIVASIVLVVICYSLLKFKNKLFPYFLFFVPFLILFAVNYSQKHTMYHHRFFLFYAIGLYIIVALAIDNLSKTYKIISGAVAVLVIVCFFLSFNYTIKHPTQDLYDSQLYMKTKITPSENVNIIHTATFSQTPFKYYFRDYQAKQLLITNMNTKELFTAGGSVIKKDEIITELPKHFYYLSDSLHPIPDKYNATKIYDNNGLIIWKNY